MKLEQITWGLLYPPKQFTVWGKSQALCLCERTAVSAAERCYVRGGVVGLVASDVSEERHVVILKGFVVYV